MSVIRTVISRILTVRCLAANDLPRLFQLEQHPSSNRWIWHAWPVDHAARAGGIWVASIQNLLVGYLAYKVVPESGEAGGPPHGNGAGPQTLPPARRLSLLRLLVAPEWRRRGIGQALVERFNPPLPQEESCCIQAVVPETHLPIQLLLRSAGYRAVGVIRSYGYEDSYFMERTIGTAKGAV